MLNRITLQGRLTKDPEVKTTASQTMYCNFTLACDRNFSGQDGQKQTDFLPCIAWKQRAQLLGNYFHKGDMMIVSGSLTSRQYDDQNGQRRYVYEVLVDEIDFCGSKSDGKTREDLQAEPLPDDNSPLPFEV